MGSNTNNRMIVMLVAGLPLTMILGATWLWYFVVHGDLDLVGSLGTSNQGSLIQPPRQITEVSLVQPDGSPYTYGSDEPRWTMLVPATGGRCDSACENMLYLTRQIHLALGKDFNRLRRVYASETIPNDTVLEFQQLSDERPAPDSFQQLLYEEHQGMQALVLPPGGFQQLFEEAADDASTWYLVDPSGWIMMSYNRDINYKDVISDLKFLLKNSSG